MPKSKDAFALKDFDAQRILQRRFFKELNLDADKTDEEILQSMKAADTDSFEETQKKYDETSAVLFKAVEYQNRIKRHVDRLTRYARALEYKITEKYKAWEKMPQGTDFPAENVALSIRHDRVIRLSQKYCGSFKADVFSTTSFLIGGIAVNSVGGLIQKMATIHKEIDSKIDTHYRKIFAARLRQARKELGLTQDDLGKLVGFSKRAISNYEKAERTPSIILLIRISQKLNRSMNWFLE